MRNFLVTVLTKMGIIQDVKNVTMLWKNIGEETTLRKRMLLERDIVKKTGIPYKKVIDFFTQKTVKKDVNTIKTIWKLTSMLKHAIAFIESHYGMVFLYVVRFVRCAEKRVNDWMVIISITKNRLKSSGFAKVVTSAYIKKINRAERLSVRTPKGEATVRTIEETDRGEIEVSFPPPKGGQYVTQVTESNRVTQCITQDLWVQNLRSTGLLAV